MIIFVQVFDDYHDDCKNILNISAVGKDTSQCCCEIV